jgi:A/G-specific adenine glycosylase
MVEHRQHEPIAGAVLAWYDRNRRDLPWRAQPGQAADPYRVWLSEVMLQQTTAAVAGRYFAAFLARWPTLDKLAAASLDEVLAAWAGLGYYARARNLHSCARTVVQAHGGRFPASEASLRALPGIGRYTAAAIAAIAFDIPAAAVDGNVERVIARLHAIDTPLPMAKPLIGAAAARLVPDHRAGDFAQGLMDLGALICTPRRPNCRPARLPSIVWDAAEAPLKGCRSSDGGTTSPHGSGRASSPSGSMARCCSDGVKSADCSAACWNFLRPHGAGAASDPLAAAPISAAWQRCRPGRAFLHTFRPGADGSRGHGRGGQGGAGPGLALDACCGSG